MNTFECHSYQAVVGPLLDKFAAREAQVMQMLINRDMPAIMAYSAKIKQHFREKVRMDYPRCDLEPMITGEIVFPDYKITKVVLQTMPGYHIPVNVYAPNVSGQKPLLPTLLVPMGHYIEGKHLPQNQLMCANFAMQGFVAATFDPVGEGERDLFPGMVRNAKQTEFAAVDEHTHVALPLNMLGENLTSLFMWDAMRVIDYLCGLPYVDPTRIGVTGQSGGGTQSTFLGVLDDRICAVSPIQAVGKTAFGVRGGMGDSEQTVFGLCEEFGVERSDLLWAIFPKKLQLNCDARSASQPSLRHVEQELSRLYDAAGIPDHFEMVVADCEHEISKETREIAYAWFGKVFGSARGPVAEREAPVLTPEELACYPKGFVTDTPYDLTRKRLALARQNAARDERPLPEKLRQLLGAYPDAYTIDIIEDRGGWAETILHTRSNGYIVCKTRNRGGTRLRVVLDAHGEVKPCDDVTTLCLTPLGMYHTAAKKEFDYDIDTNTALAGFFCGRSMFRMRLIQVITAIEYARKNLGAQTVEIAGSGQGGLLALCAALYCPMGLVEAVHTIASFESFFTNIHYIIEETSIVPGLVNMCDIPDLAAACGARVRFINPIAEDRTILSAETARALFGDAVEIVFDADCRAQAQGEGA